VTLATTVRNERFVFDDLRTLFARANEEKSGDRLAGLAAASERERVAAKSVLAELTLAEVAAAIRSRKVSSVEVTRSLLARIAAWQPTLNAFVRLEGDEALAAAAAADEALARGDNVGALHGVPLAHKDMYYVAGKLAECGSKLRKGFVAPATSTAVERLDTAGAVRLGALHMAEFAYGPTGHNEHLGPARNPWDPTRITGGSSSGSGAAVAERDAGPFRSVATGRNEVAS